MTDSTQTPILLISVPQIQVRETARGWEWRIKTPTGAVLSSRVQGSKEEATTAARHWLIWMEHGWIDVEVDR